MGGGSAWVTLATNDSYSLGALVLAHSLKQVGTQQQLAVLITPGVTSSMRTKLGEIFNVVKEVNILDSKDEANLKLLKRPELGITFTKLHCWRLTQFEKCVFLDADTLVLQNCDELFEREEFSAAPDIGWPDCFNSGVFVYRPSNDTYEKLIQFALEKGSFDGGDQGLLNLYFSDWAHKDISRHLPFIYNMSSTACYSYLPAFKQFGKNAKIIHFIGSSKPWLQYFNTETRKVHPSEGLNHLEQILQLWWNIFCDLIHPKLSTDMTSHSDTVHGSQFYTSQNITHTSYYHDHDQPSSFNPNTAEDYQNVWDPWEEYDSRQSGNESIYAQHDNNYSEPSYSQHIEHHHHHPQLETHNVQESDTHTYHFEDRSSHYHPQTDYNHTHVEHSHTDSEPSHTYTEPSHAHTEQIHEHYDNNFETDSHHHDIVERYIQVHESHIQQNLIESHNTNAFSEAEHHDHIHHPTYSQPQPPPISHNIPDTHYDSSHNSTYYEPPHNPIQDNSSNRPPPIDPRLPDECVATTTVSNEITLQTDSKEDSNDNQAGLAGAFANLTLGQARTPEQQALDDHLRRQGWEVGNIDYLGRDSFENIWSKICETLSEGTEKEASPSKTEEKPSESAVKPVEAIPEKVEPAQTPAPVAPLTPSSPSIDTPKPTPDAQKEVPVKVPETVLAATVLKSEKSTEQPSTIEKPVDQPPSAPTEATPAEISKTQISPAPTPEDAPKSETPATVASTPATIESAPSPAAAPAPATPVPETPAPATPVTETPAPATPVIDTPAPATPVTETLAPATPVTETPAPATPVTETPAPPTPVTETPAPATPVIETPAPATPVIEKPAPVTPVTETPAPATPVTETPAPATPVIEKPAPTTPVPETPVPVTPVPKTPAPVTPVTETPAPATPVPKTPAPATPVPAPVSTTPAPAPVSTTPAPAPPSPAVQSTESVPAPKASPEATKTASADAPLPASKGASQTLGESPKVPKQETAQPPTSKITEPTPPTTPSTPPTPKASDVAPPTTPVSPQPKALGIDTSVPDTPPPESAASASPTPPPRKAGGAPKKSGGKKK